MMGSESTVEKTRNIGGSGRGVEKTAPTRHLPHTDPLEEREQAARHPDRTPRMTDPIPTPWKSWNKPPSLSISCDPLLAAYPRTPCRSGPAGAVWEGGSGVSGAATPPQ